MQITKVQKPGVTLAGGDGAPYQQIPHWIRLGFCQITTIRQFWHFCKSITSKALGSISSKIYKRDLIHLNMMMFSDVAEYLHLNKMMLDVAQGLRNSVESIPQFKHQE